MTSPVEGVPCCGSGRRLIVLLAAVMCLAVIGRASLITIHPTFAPNITRDPNAAAIESTINAAINYYDSTFTTGFSPLTVNITFEETSSGLGGSSTSVFTVSYSSFTTHSMPLRPEMPPTQRRSPAFPTSRPTRSTVPET
jgi:hypothetical protein